MIEPYALLLPIWSGMIAAVDAPCVCLNVAVQRIGPLSGADEVAAEAGCRRCASRRRHDANE